MYREADSYDQLESQFILRLPTEPARILRGAIRNDTSLKERVTIKIEKDMRHGEVRVDNWLMSAKLVDLPTIIESHKTIDGKRLYKTADICQMLQCKKDDDRTSTDEDSPKKLKEDSNKAEKKYLWPHGITPPTKNIRKRRFRKTLTKEFVDSPEIEKEVKRLLKHDFECVGMTWEVMNDEDETKYNKGAVIKNDSAESHEQVAEHDVFGSAISDSEEEDVHLDVSDEFSQNTMVDTYVIDSTSVVNNSAELKLLSQFESDMFKDIQKSPSNVKNMEYCDQATSSKSFSDFHNPERNVNIQVRLNELEAQLADLKAKRHQQEAKIESIGNVALRRRLQDSLDSLVDEQMEKENEKYHLEQLRAQTNS